MLYTPNQAMPVVFQFGHGGEPWSHDPHAPFFYRHDHSSFQFGHGGEPWSHSIPRKSFFRKHFESASREGVYPTLPRSVPLAT